MVVEYLVLAFLLSFMTCGVAVPVLAWAGFMEWHRRKLCIGLRQRGVSQLADVAGPSADVPLSLALVYRGQEIRVDAVVRGEQELWHLSVPLSWPPAAAGEPRRVALIDRAWGRPLPLARSWTPCRPDVAWADARWELRTATGEWPEPFGPPLQHALTALGSGRAHLRQMVVDEDALRLEVDRVGLEAAALTPWLERTLAVADALGATSPARSLLPPAPPVAPSTAVLHAAGGGGVRRDAALAGATCGIHPASGNPLGVPGG